MGEVLCDILSGANTYCVFVRFIDTTDQKITSFKSLNNYHDPEIYQKISHVLFYGGTLPTFPSELGNFFPNVKFIEIFDCKLKTICSQDLKDLPNLVSLKLDSNEISYLPANLFEFTPKISQLSFGNNKISKIGEEIFDNLKNLKHVDLTDNARISFEYNYKHGLSILKDVIRENCKPIESLKNLSIEQVKFMINEKNVEEISMIAKNCGMDKLYRSARDYLQKMKI